MSLCAVGCVEHLSPLELFLSLHSNSLMRRQDCLGCKVPDKSSIRKPRVPPRKRYKREYTAYQKEDLPHRLCLWSQLTTPGTGCSKHPSGPSSQMDRTMSLQLEPPVVLTTAWLSLQRGHRGLCQGLSFSSFSNPVEKELFPSSSLENLREVFQLVQFGSSAHPWTNQLWQGHSWRICQLPGQNMVGVEEGPVPQKGER